MDISAFTVNIKPGELTQLGEAGGGPWGATNVDKLFEQFLVVRWNVTPLHRNGTPIREGVGILGRIFFWLPGHVTSCSAHEVLSTKALDKILSS